MDIFQGEAATYCNRALAYLKLKNFGRAIEDCNKAVELKPDYVKAYYRRGKAYASTNKFELAIKDYQHFLEIEPGNPDINKELKEVRKKLQDKLAKGTKNQEKKQKAKL